MDPDENEVVIPYDPRILQRMQDQLDWQRMTAEQQAAKAALLADLDAVDRHIGRTPSAKRSLRQQVLDALTPQQGHIVEYLWDHNTAGFDAIATVPRAFQDVPSDDAIKQAAKRINRKLCEERLPVSVTVSSSKRRLTLETPQAK